jgi:hypothetical protein
MECNCSAMFVNIITRTIDCVQCSKCWALAWFHPMDVSQCHPRSYRLDIDRQSIWCPHCFATVGYFFRWQQRPRLDTQTYFTYRSGDVRSASTIRPFPPNIPPQTVPDAISAIHHGINSSIMRESFIRREQKALTDLQQSLESSNGS